MMPLKKNINRSIERTGIGCLLTTVTPTLIKAVEKESISFARANASRLFDIFALLVYLLRMIS